MEYAGIDHYDGSGLRIISDDYFHNDITGNIHGHGSSSYHSRKPAFA